MRRRDFLGIVSVAAAAWPLDARAQQSERIRRIGVLSNLAADDPEGQARLAVFLRGLLELGWVDGRNVLVEVRWGAGEAGRIRRYAAELASLAPDVILATGASTMGPLHLATRTVPIVFVNVVDPVGAGFVASLARPGGNATGFTQFEHSIAGKWLELLKQIALGVRRAAVLRDPAVTSGIGQLAAVQAVASSFGAEVIPIDVRVASEIERAIPVFARESDGGLIVVSGAAALVHRKLIIAQASKYRLPGVYPYRFFVTDGGLMSYGPASSEPYLRAAGYVDRILKGERPADLPVQAPTKFELAINLSTAKALRLTVPPTLLARADEVIE